MVQIFLLDPIQHKPDVDEGLCEGPVEAIVFNRLTN